MRGGRLGATNTLLAAFMCFSSVQGLADDSSGLFLGGGSAYHKINVARLGYELPFSRPLSEDAIGYLSGNWEFSLGYWDWKLDQNYTLGISPVFYYAFGPDFYGTTFYIELGVGTAFLSKKYFEKRDLSSHFQFEDQLGMGLMWNGHPRVKVSLRYLHYSNFGIREPNQGIDISMLTLNIF